MSQKTATGQPVPQLINTRRAAEILGRSPATLKRWRYEGIGPEWIVLEGRVSYDLSVLLQYIAKNTQVPSVRQHKARIFAKAARSSKTFVRTD